MIVGSVVHLDVRKGKCRQRKAAFESASWLTRLLTNESFIILFSSTTLVLFREDDIVEPHPYKSRPIEIAVLESSLRAIDMIAHKQLLIG